MSTKDPTIIKLLEEINQAPRIRQELLRSLEKKKKFKNYRILLFFTSFRYPVFISNDDANIIEGILQRGDKNKKLLIIINSPGGSALAAERIVKVCREYSQNGYEVLIPKMAKSAATLIAFGAEKIYMSPTSELGPVDPQVRVGDKLMSAYSIIKSYEELLEGAIKTKGRVEPYLQQLKNYDAKKIKELKLIQGLSDDIATKCLKSGMMKKKTKTEIRRKLKMFLSPEKTKVHGRAIYPDTAIEKGLNIEIVSPDLKTWKIIWELFIRADNLVNTSVCKLVESSKHHFAAPAPKKIKNEQKT